MTAEIIEGTAIEVEQDRALVVQQPGQALVAAANDHGPADMIAMATRLATALRDIVERQGLFTVIQGKKFPQVEAWLTIGRMDNVVAREVIGGIFRHDDGSYEATVELIRLSDGMVIGRGSALCGTPDDRPWNGRGEPARRSMAVTRATSRAFRQQYSWIMALAGYEPTPADEMPDHNGETHQPGGTPPAARSGFVGTQAHPAPDLSKTPPDGLIGKAVAEGVYDFEIRQTPDGWRLPFRVKDGGKSFITVAENALAEALIAVKPAVLGERVTVWGHWTDETIPPKGDKREIRYRVLHLDRIATADFTLPAPEANGPPEQPEFDMAELDAELAS